MSKRKHHNKHVYDVLVTYQGHKTTPDIWKASCRYLTSHWTKKNNLRSGNPSWNPCVSCYATPYQDQMNNKALTIITFALSISRTSCWLVMCGEMAFAFVYYFLVDPLRSEEKDKGERKSSSPTGGKNRFVELWVHIWLSYEFVSPPEVLRPVCWSLINVFAVLLCSQFNTKAKKEWHVKKKPFW